MKPCHIKQSEYKGSYMKPGHETLSIQSASMSIKKSYMKPGHNKQSEYDEKLHEARTH